MKLRYSGWIVAISLLGVVAATGFQVTPTKIGVVDMSAVFAKSKFAQEQTKTLQDVGSSRKAMLDFLDTYRTFKPEDATRFHDLSIKAQVSSAEKAEIEKIKNDVMASDKRLKDLQTKTTLTPAESTELSELSRRIQSTTDAGGRWSNDASQEIQTLQEKLRADTLVKVREAVKQVGKDQGYTVIFINELAPYAANDVTDAALKAMDKK